MQLLRARRSTTLHCTANSRQRVRLSYGTPVPSSVLVEQWREIDAVICFYAPEERRINIGHYKANPSGIS